MNLPGLQPRLRPIQTSRLLLEPLATAHAAAMFEVLSDLPIYRYLDYPPPISAADLRQTYDRWQTRRSPDGTQLWLNWVIRPPGQAPLGYVQATVILPQTAWIAYVLSSQHWGHGYAAEAVAAMLAELVSAYDVVRFLATVEAENQRSIRLLERLGFHQGGGKELDAQELSPTERLFILSAPAR